jgi:hypothetical protein
MAPRTVRFAVATLMPAALQAFTSCSSTPVTGKVNEPTNPAAYANATDFGGEIVTDATSTTVTVVSVDHAKLHVRLPGGTQAVAAESEILSYTAKVMAINAWNDTVTLQLADGLTKTIHVSEAVNLADANVGDDVSVRATEAIVLVLEKP